MDVNKIKNGGLYLVNLDGNTNPEFGEKHYCILINTHDKDLYFAFPTTTSKKRSKELFSYILPADGSIVLFKHVRVISKHRVYAVHKDNREIQTVLTEQQIADLFVEYEKFNTYIKGYALKSVKQYHDNVLLAKNAMKLECRPSCEISNISDFSPSLCVIEYYGGTISYVINDSSHQKTCVITLTNKYNYKLITEVIINIVEEIEE